jgi:hypothetical protein
MRIGLRLTCVVNYDVPGLFSGGIFTQFDPDDSGSTFIQGINIFRDLAGGFVGQSQIPPIAPPV